MCKYALKYGLATIKSQKNRANISAIMSAIMGGIMSAIIVQL